MYMLRYISRLVLSAIGIRMIALAKVVATMGLQYIIPGSNTIDTRIVLVLYGRPI